MEYRGPTPPVGNHRYIFTLFEQPAEVSVAPPSSRASFTTKEFAESNAFVGPVAGVFFFSEN